MFCSHTWNVKVWDARHPVGDTRVGEIMANRILYFLASTLIGLSACSTPKFYRAQLLENKNPQDEQYTVLMANSAEMPKDKKFQVVLREVKAGFLHDELSQNLKGKKTVNERTRQALITQQLGGKQLWLVADARTVSNADVFGLKETRIVSVTSVKLDQESFSYVPVDSSEAVILKGIAESSYYMELKLYEVEDYELKRAIYRIGSSSLGKVAIDAIKGVTAATGNYLLKEVIELGKQVEKEPLFWEQLLLASKAKLQLKGTFYLTVVEDHPGEKETESARRLALYDYYKSELDFDYDQSIDPDAEYKRDGAPSIRGVLPTSPDDYIQHFLLVHGKKSIELPSAAEIKKKLDAPKDSTSPDPGNVVRQLKKTFIKFDLDYSERLQLSSARQLLSTNLQQAFDKFVFSPVNTSLYLDRLKYLADKSPDSLAGTNETTEVLAHILTDKSESGRQNRQKIEEAFYGSSNLLVQAILYRTLQKAQPVLDEYRTKFIANLLASSESNWVPIYAQLSYSQWNNPNLFHAFNMALASQLGFSIYPLSKAPDSKHLTNFLNQVSQYLSLPNVCSFFAAQKAVYADLTKNIVALATDKNQPPAVRLAALKALSGAAPMSVSSVWDA